MIQKIILSIILVILIFISVNLIVGKSHFGIKLSELELSSRKLKIATAQLEKINSSEFEDKKKELEEAIQQYNNVKKTYEDIVEKNPQLIEEIAFSQAIKSDASNKVYDIEFLWTILGNYATGENLMLDMNVKENTTSIDSVLKYSNDYEVCDLELIVSGEYMNLVNFIYNLENDNRLNFRISEFNMDYKNKVEVVLNIRNIKISSKNLLETRINEDIIEDDDTNTVSNITNLKETN